MALIMITGNYPPSKQEELLKAGMSENKPPYPQGVKKIHNWVAQVTSGHYKIYAVYECPDESVGEALGGLIKHYNFYAQVEGYQFSTEIIWDADEALRSWTE